MSLKQIVLDMTSEARQELKELIDFIEAKEAELKAEIAAEEAEEPAAPVASKKSK